MANLGSTTTTSHAGAGSGGGATSDEHGSLVKYARCMRSHGASKFPDPTSSTGSIKVTKRSLVSTPNFQAASRSCAKYAPAGRASPTLTSKDRSDYLKAAACMRSHGIAGFPDPVFSGSSNVSFPIPGTMDTNSPQFLRARGTCEKLIPPGLPYSKQDESGQ